MIIRCPSCGEELEIEELIENSEIKCDVCNLTMLYRNKKILDMNSKKDL